MDKEYLKISKVMQIPSASIFCEKVVKTHISRHTGDILECKFGDEYYEITADTNARFIPEKYIKADWRTQVRITRIVQEIQSDIFSKKFGISVDIIADKSMFDCLCRDIGSCDAYKMADYLHVLKIKCAGITHAGRCIKNIYTREIKDGVLSRFVSVYSENGQGANSFLINSENLACIGDKYNLIRLQKNSECEAKNA